MERDRSVLPAHVIDEKEKDVGFRGEGRKEKEGREEDEDGCAFQIHGEEGEKKKARPRASPDRAQMNGGVAVLEFFDVDVAPLHGSTVGLELNGACFGKRSFFVEEVEELGVVNDELAVEVNGHLFANELDGDGIPFANRLVGMDEGFATFGALGVVPEASGTFFGAVFPAATGFGGVPELNLGNSAEVDSTVGLGIEFEFKAKLEIGVIFLGGEVEAVAVVVDDAVFDLPVLGDVFEALFLFGGEFVLGESQIFGGIFGTHAPPSGEVLAVEKGRESFGSTREERGDHEGEAKQYCFHVVKIHDFETMFITKSGKLADAGRRKRTVLCLVRDVKWFCEMDVPFFGPHRGGLCGSGSGDDWD